MYKFSALRRGWARGPWLRQGKGLGLEAERANDPSQGIQFLEKLVGRIKALVGESYPFMHFIYFERERRKGELLSPHLRETQRTTLGNRFSPFTV